jgi:hypothetical protein
MENTQVSKSHKFHWNLSPIKPSNPNSFHTLCNEKFLSMVVACLVSDLQKWHPTHLLIRENPLSTGAWECAGFYKNQVTKAFGSWVHFNNPSLCQTPHPCPLAYEPLLKSILFLSILHGHHQVVPRISLHSLVPMQHTYIYCCVSPFF